MNNGDDFEDDLAAYNERQREEGIDDENLDQQPDSAIPEFNPVLNADNIDTDQNLEDIQSQQPQPKAMSDKEEEEEEDEEGFYKDEEEEEQETPVSVQELKP